MKFEVNLCKFLLATVGKVLPLRRHPGGGISNKLRCLFAKGIVNRMGENCIIESGAEILEDCVFGDGTSIGPNCMVGPGTVILGDNLMGPCVKIYTTGHFYDDSIHQFRGQTERKVVSIGKQVWIGYGTIILPGVKIGNNVIIGAGSVVSKDIPSGVMAAGNPCVVKKIIDQDIYKRGNSFESITY